MLGQSKDILVRLVRQNLTPSVGLGQQDLIKCCFKCNIHESLLLYYL